VRLWNIEMNEIARVRGLVRDAGGAVLLERLDHLEALRHAPGPIEEAPPSPGRGAARDFDVILAGGGLWLLLAPVLAARGLRVAVFERARAGTSHREWNASGPELRALVRAGLLTSPQVEGLIVARYRTGICGFHRGGTYEVPGVLDHAVDAGGLLAHARRLAEERGVTFFDGCTVGRHAAGPDAIAVRVRERHAVRDVTASVLVDARGAASPHATADLVCPTVGGVLSGLRVGDAREEVNPTVGEILVTVDPIEDGRQYVWEGFPGRAGELTTYLFYYARSNENVSLLTLYGRFFRTLSTYKRGDAKLVRPTFGFIPGWSRMSPAPAPASARLVLVGDAAARHSPLTYCGFGATLRSLVSAADAIERTVSDGTSPPCVVHDAPIHALTGALAYVMASRRFRGDELNELLDAAFAVLHGMGPGPYAELLRDEMDVPSFVQFLRRTAAKHPAAWSKVVRGLGLKALGRWSVGLAGSWWHSGA
jgi:lycopene cyclase CruA